MSDRIHTLNRDFSYGDSLVQRNRVLRNTYWLLALSLVPTVLGAWVGIATGMTQALTGGIGLIVFLAGAFGFIYAIEKTKNSAAGVPVLLGFAFLHGFDAVAPDRIRARLQERARVGDDRIRWHSRACFL